MRRSRVFEVRARGPLACFTRPEMKVERMSYEVMTPSAARGLLEAILWKPAIKWHIDSITVGAPIQWVAFRRNEVNGRASDRTYFADEDRTQRNTVALRDVDYLVRAHFELTERVGADDTVVKFEEMFHRRLQRGQHFYQPCLGCREFVADASPAVEGFAPVEESRSLGLMFFDYDYRSQPPRPLFFDAKLEKGVMVTPSLARVLEENGARP